MGFAHWFLTLLCPGGGIKWLLRDEFSDTRAAGSVDGTPATPGPGTRAATDTDGDALSIGGGVAQFANPNSAFDPGLWYGGVSRVAGRVLLQRLQSVAGTNRFKGGWANAQAGEPHGAALDFFMLGSSNVRLYAGAVPRPYVPLADTTVYRFALVLRASGVYLFIKDGTFTNWTLLWPESSDVTATLYPSFVNWKSTSYCDFVRIPDELWLPTPLAYDTFTRANGAIGSSETTGPDGQAVPARAWNNRVGTTQIATNKASASVLDGGIAIATVDTGTVNAITDATLAQAGNEVGVVLRYADADNYIRAIHDGTNCKLVKRVAAAETDVISAVVALGAGAIRVISDGTSFSLYLNNVQVGATSTISDAALQTGTEQGLFSTNVGNTQDGFLVFPRGSGGEYAALNKWSS